jgi:NAD(P)-dependent dehydrogenase (short-subunit alcohol dehydrogenase family)
VRHVVVTGVSTGIGRGIASVLAESGFHVFGSVRREADAAAFKSAFGDNATPLLFDVTDELAVRQAAALVSEAVGGAGLAGLVNNAGITVQGPLELVEIAALRRQFEVNTIAQVAVSQAFLPLLGASLPRRADPGRIVNITSVGGKVALPFLGPYAASKFALEALSDSLRRELSVYGIDVVVIEPGSIDTPIWAKGEAEDIGPYVGTPYFAALERFRKMAGAIGRSGLPPKAVGRAVLKALTVARPRTRYVVQAGGGFRFLLMRLLPDRLLDRLIARQLRYPPG